MVTFGGIAGNGKVFPRDLYLDHTTGGPPAIAYFSGGARPVPGILGPCRTRLGADATQSA